MDADDPVADDLPTGERVPACVPDETTIAGWSDDELADVIALAMHEQMRRAVDACDPDALVELGFAEGFKSDGMPVEPWLAGGIVVCPGAKIDKSASSHQCAFVAVGDDWVWEYEDRLADVIRHLPGVGSRQKMQSVSLVVAHEGLELDFVVSKMSAGTHQMCEVRSFVIEAGELKLVNARSRRPDRHR